ncbi:MAG: MBL fold metallo-hydrolase [Paludibacteraceae bacterium]|nr:MBL fold metallo-hydrolase [Paludibacteraceae bacterium]
MTIQFLGAAKEVTGSKHLITTQSGKRILLDCGMYQGKGMETDAANRELGFDPKQIDYLILSHAHIDHSGLIPYIYRMGFRGDIISTPATRDLCAIMLQDTAYIQAQDIRWYNKKMDRLHKPKVDPLYDINHAQQCMKLFISINYDRKYKLCDDVMVTLTNSGHMLGSAVISLEIKEGGEWKRIAYTGDLGRQHSHILCSPQLFPQCDYLICESTYGDRTHDNSLVSEEELLHVVEDTCVYKKGKLLIPSFSVGRTQEIVYVLNKLYNEGSLPKIKVYVDSPLSVNATHIFRMYTDALNEDVQDSMRFDDDPFGFSSLKYITDINESKALNNSDEPCIIISASGMLEAGRIKHHVANHISDPSTTILIVGYCTPTSLGARIQDPKLQWVSIFGFDHKIKAQVTKIEGFSGHGDYREMIDYISRSQNISAIRRTFIVHGESAAQEAYKDHLYEAGFRNIDIPDKGYIVHI